MSEFIEILKKDYADNESLRLRIINKLPHYGTDEELTNGLCKKDFPTVFFRVVKDFIPIAVQRLCPAHFHTMSNALPSAKRTGATPDDDGRNAEYPLSSGSSPVQGRETKAPLRQCFPRFLGSL